MVVGEVNRIVNIQERGAVLCNISLQPHHFIPMATGGPHLKPAEAAGGPETETTANSLQPTQEVSPETEANETPAHCGMLYIGTGH